MIAWVFKEAYFIRKTGFYGANDRAIRGSCFMWLERQTLLLEGKLEGFDQWLRGIFGSVGKLQLDLKTKAFG